MVIGTENTVLEPDSGTLLGSTGAQKLREKEGPELPESPSVYSFCRRRWIMSEQNKIDEQSVYNLKRPMSHYSPLSLSLSFSSILSFLPLWWCSFLPLLSLISWI